MSIRMSKAGSADRGWIKQEKNQIDRGKRNNICVPPGKQLSHKRGKEAAKGFPYEHSDLQNEALHKTQHQMERKLKKQ